MNINPDDPKWTAYVLGELSDAERVLQVWRLSQELWQLRGGPPDEPRLRRSVTRIQRR